MGGGATDHVAYKVLFIQPESKPGTPAAETKILATGCYYCVVPKSCLFVTPWTLALQAPLSLRFSRQEYWSRLPFPSPEDLPNAGTEHLLCLLNWQVGSSPLVPPGKPQVFLYICKFLEADAFKISIILKKCFLST